ncbi:MAG: hypothetical protein ACXVA9_05075 [Bdellovibrionales bacterium]
MASKSPQQATSSVSDYDLWIIPPAAHSQWFARIDWYLNWQMSKGLAHQRQKPSVELFRVMEEAGIQFHSEPESPSAPLMVASAGKVGSERCIVLDYKNDLKPWLQFIHQLCAGLHSKRALVYLPKGVNSAEAKTQWSKLAPLDLQLEFSMDEDTHHDRTN